MKRTHLPTLLLLLCLVATAQAQPATIQGTVRDAAGETLPGVNVVVDGTARGAATNAAGFYAIAGVPAGARVLVASAVGFETARQALTLAPGEAVTVDFVLEEKLIESDEVVVTASRRAQRFSEAPISLSIVQPRELDLRNVVSLDDALRYVPGVQMAENQVNIRGSSGFSYNTGSRVLLLLDGMPLLAPDRESLPFDALPIAQVERIEVVKGPGSALYGGGALGGVINVITKDFPARPETSVRLFGGVYEPVRYGVWREKWSEGEEARPFGGGSFTHARRFGPKFGTWVNVAYRADTGHTNFNEERELDAFLKLGWRPKTTLRFDLLTGWTRSNTDSFFYWNGTLDPLNPGELVFGDLEFKGTNDQQTNLFSVLPAFTHVVSPKLLYTLKGRLFGLVIQPLNDDGTPKPIADGTIGFRYGGEAQLSYSPRPGRYLTLGGTLDALATESSFFQPDSLENILRAQPEYAAFGQWEQRLFGRLDVVLGLRYDIYEIDEGDVARKLSPKVSAAFPLAEGTTLRAAFGQGFRVPGLAERFVDNDSFLPIVKNLALRPEESTGYEIGLRSVLDAPQRGALSADLALFWNDYEGLVEPKFIVADGKFQFVNLTRARIRGMEVAVEGVSARERLTFQAGYTLLDHEDLTDDRPLAFRSSHLVTASLDARLAGPLTAGLDFRYNSAPDRIDSDFARFVPDAEVMVATRVLDARLGARWTHFRLGLLVKNALDYYYAERPAILAPPRQFILQVQADI